MDHYPTTGFPLNSCNAERVYQFIHDNYKYECPDMEYFKQNYDYDADYFAFEEFLGDQPVEPIVAECINQVEGTTCIGSARVSIDIDTGDERNVDIICLRPRHVYALTDIDREIRTYQDADELLLKYARMFGYNGRLHLYLSGHVTELE